MDLHGSHGSACVTRERHGDQDGDTVGFLLLVPAGGDRRFFLAKEGRAGLIDAKIKRVPFVASNGILVLIPAALFLASKAKAADFNTTFYEVQTLELLAGATNIFLLGLI